MMTTNKSNNILVAITNYNFSNNADLLKNNFSKFFDTILIDSSSDIKPYYTDIVIANNFYTGLWNESVKLALEKQYDWLFFIASDITLLSDMNFIHNIALNITNNTSIGIYSPSVDSGSRCSFPSLFNANTNTLRETSFVEGFVFLARTNILKKMYPVDYDLNKYGYCLDITMCHIGKKLKYKVIVDDRFIIHHPKTIHPIDKNFALQQGNNYYNKIKNI